MTKYKMLAAFAVAVLITEPAHAALVTPTSSGYLTAGTSPAYPLGGIPSTGTIGNTYDAKTFIHIDQTVNSTNDAYTLAIHMTSGTGVESFDNFTNLNDLLTFVPTTDCSFSISSTYAESGKSQAFTKYYLTEMPTGVSYAYQYQSSTAANFATVLPPTAGQLRAGYTYKLGVEIQNSIPGFSTVYSNTTATADFQISLAATPDPSAGVLLVPASLLMRRPNRRLRAA